MKFQNQEKENAQKKKNAQAPTTEEERGNRIFHKNTIVTKKREKNLGLCLC